MQPLARRRQKLRPAFRYGAQFAKDGGDITDNIERILGRKPIAMDHWATENAGTFH